MSAPDGLITCLQCSTLKCYYEYEVQEQGPGNRMVKYQDELHDNIDTWRMFCFHFDCHNCPPSKKLDSLCEKCCHLRLRHIVRCGLYNYFAPENEGNRTRGTGLVFDLGTLEQVRESASHCVMCEVFANVAQAQNKPQALPDHILEIYIDLSKRSLLRVNYSFKLGLRLKDEYHKYRNFPYTWVGLADIPNPEIRKFAEQPRPQPNIPWETLKYWMQDCDSKHGPDCHRELSPEPSPGFRLIDIQKGMIIKPSIVHKYATLSYVWGETKATDLQATMENIQSLETEGSLSHNEDIPAAITDAMTVCSRLGIEFLWVDRLCIVQDDFQEKSRQINAMENIYGNCYITVAQLQGDGAHSGLCGVSRPRKALAGPSQAGDIYLIREYDQYETIKSHSKWVTRGWTFQEAFLSSRLLLFSEQGVIFECQDGEKINIEDRALRETEFMNIEFQFDLSVPQRIIEEYTKRDLTLEADILFAFTGILHHQFGTEHYYGNCLSRFQHLLLWRSSEDKYTPRVPQGDMIFPSWSWISINGPIEFPYIGAENSAGNLALWMLVFNGSIRLIPYLEVTRDKESIRKRKLMKLIAIIAWRNGLLPSKLPSCFEPDANWQHYLDIIESRWSKSYDMYTEAMGIDHRAITAPSVAEKFSQGMISLGQEPGRVLVYTSSLVLTVKPQSLKEGGAVFMTQNGRVLGTSEWSTKMKQGELNNFLETLEKHPTTQLDALALSLVEVSTSLDHVEEGLWRDSTGAPLQELPDPISFPGDYDYNHPSEYGSLTTILITVMLVETRCGISRRVGIGEFFLHDWVSSGPQLRPFVLA